MAADKGPEGQNLEQLNTTTTERNKKHEKRDST